VSVLLTGFEPFGGDALNSSWELARRLDGVDGIRAVQLPCRFAHSLQALDAALAHGRPRLVLALGQAASRPLLSFERVALNWVDARIADNDGLQPIDEPVLPGAPAAHFSTLPIKAMAQAVRGSGVPAEISYSAGSFVCNQVFFGLQHRLRRRRGVRSGFGQSRHGPADPDQRPPRLRPLCRCSMAPTSALESRRTRGADRPQRQPASQRC
jgi:pyroglutamyl-peptidase